MSARMHTHISKPYIIRNISILRNCPFDVHSDTRLRIQNSLSEREGERERENREKRRTQIMVTYFLCAITALGRPRTNYFARPTTEETLNFAFRSRRIELSRATVRTFYTHVPFMRRKMYFFEINYLSSKFIFHFFLFSMLKKRNY